MVNFQKKYPIQIITANNDKNNDFLHTESQNVKTPLSKEDLKIVKKLKKYLYDSQNQKLKEKYSLREGVGLSAVQIGYLKKIFYVLVNLDEDELVREYCFANTKIIEHNSPLFYLDSGEGCLSVNDPIKKVLRSSWIKIHAYDVFKKKYIEEEFSGVLAVIIQHEIDHGNGILYIDKIAEINEDLHEAIHFKR